MKQDFASLLPTEFLAAPHADAEVHSLANPRGLRAEPASPRSVSPSPNARRLPVAVVVGIGANPLGAVRSLHLAGISTVVVTGDQNNPAFLSRYPVRRVLIPSSSDRDAALLAVLESLPYERPVLIPTNDFLVSFMARHHERLASQFRVCMPEPWLAETLLDKTRETELVRRAGIPLPKTFLDLRMLCQQHEDIEFPVIIKPRTAWDAKRFGEKNRVVRSPRELQTVVAAHEDMLDSLLAQEVIPGDDSQQWVCNCTFGRSNDLLCAFVFRRFHLSPAHRGVTSYAVSERNHQVLSLVARLGRGLKYTGPAMVEFKFDARDGQYKYLELNPRIGMCNFFDTTCGVNNVYQTYRLAAGTDVGPSRRAQRDGVIYLSLHSDLYSRVEDGERLLSILYDYLSNVWRPHVGPYFSLSDLRPALAEGSRFVGAMARRLWRKALAHIRSSNRDFEGHKENRQDNS